jgi:hypothetical protein
MVAFALAGITACIIGPKQDDPETAAFADTGPVDTGDFAVSDTGRSDPDVSSLPGDDAGALHDAVSGADSAPKADVGCGDASDAGDAACDGGGADAADGG